MVYLVKIVKGCFEKLNHRKGGKKLTYFFETRSNKIEVTFAFKYIENSIQKY